MKLNYITELSVTILELIYENNKDSVTKNNQPVNGEHQQTNWKEHLKFYKIFWWWTLLLLSTCVFSLLWHFCEHPWLRIRFLDTWCISLIYYYYYYLNNNYYILWSTANPCECGSGLPFRFSLCSIIVKIQDKT